MYYNFFKVKTKYFLEILCGKFCFYLDSFHKKKIEVIDLVAGRASN